MKKQILNLGKALNKTEQKNIFGGAIIRHQNGNCANAIEGNRPYGCPCSSGSQCPPNVGYRIVDYPDTAFESTGEYYYTAGTCEGVCI